MVRQPNNSTFLMYLLVLTNACKSRIIEMTQEFPHCGVTGVGLAPSQNRYAALETQIYRGSDFSQI
jgi:hypothetical protein